MVRLSNDGERVAQGHGTCEDTLMRVLVSRSEVDLKKILEEYSAMYDSSLQEHILVRLSSSFPSRHCCFTRWGKEHIACLLSKCLSFTFYFCPYRKTPRAIIVMFCWPSADLSEMLLLHQSWQACLEDSFTMKFYHTFFFFFNLTDSMLFYLLYHLYPA